MKGIWRLCFFHHYTVHGEREHEPREVDEVEEQYVIVEEVVRLVQWTCVEMVLVLEYDFVWVVMSCSWLCDEMNMLKEEWANEIRDLKERIICVWWKNEWIEISTTRDWVLIGTRDDVWNRKDWNETIKPRMLYGMYQMRALVIVREIVSDLRFYTSPCHLHRHNNFTSCHNLSFCRRRSFATFHQMNGSI